MSYNSDSQVKFGKIAVELLSFRTGPTSYIRSCTHTDAVTIQGQIYQPNTFNRGQVKIASAPEDTAISITVPLDHPIAAHYQTIPIAYDVQVEVRQGHLTEDGLPTANNLATDYPVMIMGWIGDVERDTDADEMKLNVITLGATLLTPTQSRQFQIGCMHKLYGKKCQAVRNWIAPIGMPTVGPNTLAYTTPWTTEEVERFIGGTLAFRMPNGVTEYRQIIAVTDLLITFGGSARPILGYSSIEVVFGCAHTMADCARHNNTRRYGGFPDMPMDNPVGKSLDK